MVLVIVAALVYAVTSYGPWNERMEPRATPTVHIITPSESPTVPVGITSVAQLVGDWSDPKANWTVHFKADGSFVEDFEGVAGFRSGTYKLQHDRVFLVGGEGDVDTGQIIGDTVVFRLGTLTRVAGQ